MPDFDELLPGETQEQDQHLIHDLHRMYHTDTQKAEQLARIRQRLLTNREGSAYDHESTQQRYMTPNMQQARMNNRSMKQIRSSIIEGESWQQRFSTIAAVLIVTLLVGSLLLVLSRAHQSSVGGPGNTLHPSKPAGGTGNLLSLHMIDSTTGWALSEHAVLRTTDGGLQWKNVTPPNTHLSLGSVAEFYTASLTWIATPQANSSEVKVLRTADGGQTWQQVTIPAAFPREINFIDYQHGWILASWRPQGGAAEAVSVFCTSDGGKTWSIVSRALAASTDIPPPGHLPFGGQKSGIHFLNRSTGWITGTVVAPDLAWLYVTHDSGSTWHRQTLPLPPGVPSGQMVIMSPTFFSATDGILPITFSDVATGHGIATDIYVTHDGGMTWQSTTPVSAALGTIDFLDMQHGWATDGIILYSTSDGGQHWTKRAPGMSFKQVIYLNFVSSTIGWAISRQGNSSSSLLKTTDGGQTWMSIFSTTS
jgi:photosystem II stability/assembly factor-like uncharacterized protein